MPAPELVTVSVRSFEPPMVTVPKSRLAGAVERIGLVLAPPLIRTSTPAVAELMPLATAEAVERITVPLGGGFVESTSAANCTVTLCPAAVES